MIDATTANQQESAAPRVIAYLKSAPHSFTLPAVIPACKKAKDGTHIKVNPPLDIGNRQPASEVTNNLPRIHKEQPVDFEARQLAQCAEKPACWKDLYWHLIGSRGLKRDEDKVRALFTWLCSKPHDEHPFPVMDDGVQTKGNGKVGKSHIDSPDVVLPKLAEGKANYVQVSLTFNGIAVLCC